MGRRNNRRERDLVNRGILAAAVAVSLLALTACGSDNPQECTLTAPDGTMQSVDCGDIGDDDTSIVIINGTTYRSTRYASGKAPKGLHGTIKVPEASKPKPAARPAEKGSFGAKPATRRRK